ncbi:MAG: sulfotransferase [Alphaproteobacteria bacterium]|nr:sulfotransferase [Alphaproteobacteria bacterium]
MILITGAARSGTSLTARILQAHGVCLGADNQVNTLWEHQAIRQDILKPMLRAIGADPLGQGPLPHMTKFRPDPALRNRIEWHFLGRPRPWGYKDAKITLTWPMWHAAFPDAKWIIVRRETDAIIDSCLRTHFMKRYGDNRDGWHQWVAFHLKQFKAMAAADVDVLEVWPQAFIEDPSQFSEVTDFCNLPFRQKHVTEAIDPALWRS